ncbi:hypothetical protein PFY12_12630 [Chryseobacterium camelliae]|uniref:Replication initiation protein n=1 Tax=Chryseobacterium camelliae TaxID=1265445 RepID=A0ABY7QJR3_9FLAO|nr:hypothetical protein [Chryseobacterium camelliae]WBV59885.1 hypothetical protein PFY12_12630 [Chryseobacterium camelliae]
MLKKVEFISDTADIEATKNIIESELFNFQIDFVKLEIPCFGIKFKNLVEHSTIKKQYSLKPEVWKHHKNFNIYFTEKKATLKFSLPYFLHGHNYCKLEAEDLLKIEGILSKKLGISIGAAKVKELEFGAYENSNDDGKNYVDSILGIKNYELEKSTKGFKMFGDRKRHFHYKIYDAVANAKAKKTFTLGNYPENGLIKHEIKLTNVKPYFENLKYSDLYNPFADYIGKLKKDLMSSRKSLILKNENPVLLHDTDLTHILYAGLKQYENGVASENVVKSLFNLVENSGLTPSQKSKRRKAINLLEDHYNQRF